MSDQVFVNGRAFSRSSCQLKMEGEEFFGFDTIEFGQSRVPFYKSADPPVFFDSRDEYEKKITKVHIKGQPGQNDQEDATDG
jgi:hypothetical protein